MRPHTQASATLAALAALLLSVVAHAWVTPDDPAYRPYPDDPHQGGLFLLDMQTAWQHEKGSPDVIVGIIDWAFDTSHPDLTGKLWRNLKETPGNGVDDDANGFVDDVHGWDFVDGDATLDGETQRHGTHVAGIIGAQTNNGVGIAGMAPHCPLMLVKVGLAGVLRDGALMARAIRYCVDNGANVICKNHGLSEHYPGWHVPVGGALKEACDYAYRKGVLIVSGTTSNDGRFYPAGFQGAYDSAMGTGASDIAGKPSDMQGGSLFCEVIAPGGDRKDGSSANRRSVYSCYSEGAEYAYSAGGCMANPHVAGLAALVLSHYPDIDIEQARQIIRNTAKSRIEGFDVRWGHGLIQPARALSLPPAQLAARAQIVSGVTPARADSDGRTVYAVKVRNEGAFDALAEVVLRAEGAVVGRAAAVLPGLETTRVLIGADTLPPSTRPHAWVEDVRMNRPPIFDTPPDIRLHIAAGDIGLLDGDAGEQLVVRVHNDGSDAAPRVLVLLHHNEPAAADRTGAPSRMIAGAVIEVPAGGSSTASFPVADLPSLGNLWAEIENLAVGAPHVARQGAKAAYRIEVAAPDPVEPTVEFLLDEGEGRQIADSRQHRLSGRIQGAAWTRDGETTCLAFDGAKSLVQIADHPALAEMSALRIDVRVKLEQAGRTIEPLVYKWLSGRQSASFGLGLLRGSPYCLIRTTGPGYVETVCSDLRVPAGEWHTVSLIYTGAWLTAAVDNVPSAMGTAAFGPIAACPRPMLLGAAADKTGKLVSFLSGKLGAVGLSVPPPVEGDTRVPGALDVAAPVRVLLPGRPEEFSLSVPRTGLCQVALEMLQDACPVSLSIHPEGREGDTRTGTITWSQPAWQGVLQAGVHAVRLQSGGRVVYRLRITGADDIWQRQFSATDRGAGAQAGYFAWLRPLRAGAGRLEIYDCSEGARLLLSADGRRPKTILQTGGVMGDSSVQTGGAGLWRAHSFSPGTKPWGAWLYCPSALNAAGDYAIRGSFTVHWRRPPDAVRKRFARSPVMSLSGLRVRGAGALAMGRREAYANAVDAGLRFMQALTEPRGEGYRIYERWLVDRDAPRIYWGSDGQMLCARTYYHAYLCTRQERLKQIALGIARRVIAHQNMDATDSRHGALPYGFVGAKEKISWGSSSNIQGKILYGLAQLATWSEEPDLLSALKRNADYYVRMQYDNGRWPHFVERRPHSVCGYPTAWGVAGLLIAYRQLGDAKYLSSARKALEAYLAGRQPDGSILCHCTHGGGDKEDNHAIRSSLTMLTPFSLAYAITQDERYSETLSGLRRFLSGLQDPSGVFKFAHTDCVNLIYAQNWGIQGLCAAYEATREPWYLQAAFSLADFFTAAQLTDEDPHRDGAWVGSYNIAKGSPGGDLDDEGNAYDLYTSWGAGPIVYGLQRLLSYCAGTE